MFKQIPIKKIRGITISQISDEFIIHVSGENDLNLISNKRSDIIQILDDAYIKIKKKRLKFAEVNEKSLNPYIEYKSRKELMKKKSAKKLAKVKESNNSSNKKKSTQLINQINDKVNDSINIKEKIDEPVINREPSNDKIKKNLNKQINEQKEHQIENQIKQPVAEPINKFEELEENINISEIQNKENNIISDMKSNPLLEKKESTDTIFSSHKQIKQVKNEDFKILKILGRGSFGKVCLVEYLPTHEIYAMKSLKKDILIQEEKIESTLLEKEIMQTINHPFLVELIFCFQTEQRINFVMPFIPGGELFQHLKKSKHFGEHTVKFYAAQIAIAIQYLHDMGIAYRDLKPENILIDEKGYLRLTDFGLAKKLKDGEKTNSFCGTPEYLAPEIINGQGYDKNIDWWAFGILIYEMICGIPPFYVQDVNKMYYLIKNEKIKFDRKFLISKDAKDLMTRLLDKNIENRLCVHEGLEELKKHPFFKSIDFDAILRKEIEAPYVPRVKNSTDVENFDKLFTDEKLDMSSILTKNLDLVNQNQYKFNKFSP